MEKVSVRAKLVNKLLIVAVVILMSFIISLQIAGVNFEQKTMMAIVIFVLATSGSLFYLHQTLDIFAAKLDLVDTSLPYLKNNDLNGFDNLNQDVYPAFFRSVSRLMVLEEKELATSNEQLAAINKSLAVIEFNIDGTIITANDNFLMTLGYRLEEIQGQHHSMFVEPEYKTSIEYQQFWAKLNRGEFDKAEYKRIGKEGKEVWIQASYNPILDSQGKVCKVVKFATDITATKLAMSDFQGQISAIDKSQAVIEFNLDGIILNANDNFLNSVDYQLNEIKGKHHSMFVEPEYKASSEYQQFWDKLNRGEFQTGEYKRIGKFGKEIWIQASYNPIFDLNGNVYKVVKFATEVTSTKLVMADFEGQISAIDKSQAVIEFNMDGTIINANDNFLNTVGYQLNEIKGQHHSMFVEPEYKVSSEYQQFWQKLNRGEFEAGEYKRIGQGGKEVWIQASYNPIFDLNGKPFKVVKYASDITEQKNQAEATALIARTVSALDVCQANVMMADADYNIVYVNEAVKAMLSVNEQQLRTVLPSFNVIDLIGTNIDTFHVNPAHQRGMLDRLTSTYKTNLELAGFTFGLIATPVFNDDNERIGTVVEWEDKTERLAAERAAEAIANENARTANALQVCQANVMMADADLNIVYVNDAVKGMLRSREKQLQELLPNFSVDSLIGTCVDDFHKNPAHQRGMLDKLKDVYKTDLNLGELTFGLIATPVFNDSGERVGTVVEWEDKTERLAAEKIAEDIANANSRTTSALDVCQANVMMADADYNIVYVNEAVTAMLSTNEQQLRTVLPRFDVASLIGTNIDTFHKNPAHQRGMLDNLKSTYQTDLELAGFTFGLIATPVFNDNGERLGTVVEWEDKTERLARERAERAEAAENLRIKQALDNVSANAMIADAGNNIVFMNEAVQGMMRDAEADIRTDLPNFNSNNLVGQNVDVFHKNPAHQQNMLKNLASTYKTEIVVGGRTFSLIANPITSDNGERVGTVVEWNDRTAEVAIEKEIDGIIASAGRGELDARLEEGDKSGFFLNLTQGLNTLVEIVDDAVAETGFMLDAMAHGDLTKRIDQDYQGSFDKLKRDANTTAEKLTEVIDQINTSATLVASGAEEISQGNADLSQRTEEQASSLEETASSMEEMTSTVRQNADNAKVANELAANTQDQASQGGQVVQRAVTSMAEINDSSKKISDIIGVIDEIAFQTNLLALNAAVEAARAGEQGRGFAVVAGEVRNLAQRSAAAAKEIKELIRDSVSKVEDGTLLVNESGTTLQKIVLSVQKVTEMIADITVASEEQSSGIEQVNKAITQMDEMTQQNAALVEEASAAGESMAEQANGMRQLLTFFKSNAGGHASALPAPTHSKPAPKTATPSRSQRLSSPSTGDDFVDSADEWEEF